MHFLNQAHKIFLQNFKTFLQNLLAEDSSSGLALPASEAASSSSSSSSTLSTKRMRLITLIDILLDESEEPEPRLEGADPAVPREFITPKTAKAIEELKCLAGIVLSLFGHVLPKEVKETKEKQEALETRCFAEIEALTLYGYLCWKVLPIELPPREEWTAEFYLWERQHIISREKLSELIRPYARFSHPLCNTLIGEILLQEFEDLRCFEIQIKINGTSTDTAVLIKEEIDLLNRIKNLWYEAAHKGYVRAQENLCFILPQHLSWKDYVEQRLDAPKRTEELKHLLELDKKKFESDKLSMINSLRRSNNPTALFSEALELIDNCKAENHLESFEQVLANVKKLLPLNNAWKLLTALYGYGKLNSKSKPTRKEEEYLILREGPARQAWLFRALFISKIYMLPPNGQNYPYWNLIKQGSGMLVVFDTLDKWSMEVDNPEFLRKKEIHGGEENILEIIDYCTTSPNPVHQNAVALLYQYGFEPDIYQYELGEKAFKKNIRLAIACHERANAAGICSLLELWDCYKELLSEYKDLDEKQKLEFYMSKVLYFKKFQEEESLAVLETERRIFQREARIVLADIHLQLAKLGQCSLYPALLEYEAHSKEGVFLPLINQGSSVLMQYRSALSAVVPLSHISPLVRELIAEYSTDCRETLIAKMF